MRMLEDSEFVSHRFVNLCLEICLWKRETYIFGQLRYVNSSGLEKRIPRGMCHPGALYIGACSDILIIFQNPL